VVGVENLFKHLGFIEGRAQTPRRQTVVDGFLSLLAGRGGFVEYRAALYDHLQKGDPVADVTDPFGTVLETVYAPQESIFWARPLRPMVATGEAVAMLGKNIRYV
jgi:predicted deacylase